MRNFKTLNSWKEGNSIVKPTYNIAKLLPEEEKIANN